MAEEQTPTNKLYMHLAAGIARSNWNLPPFLETNVCISSVDEGKSGSDQNSERFSDNLNSFRRKSKRKHVDIYGEVCYQDNVGARLTSGRNFFSKVKIHLDDADTYLTFLKCFHFFSRGFIAVDDFIRSFVELVGNDTDLVMDFDELVNFGKIDTDSVTSGSDTDRITNSAKRRRSPVKRDLDEEDRYEMDMLLHYLRSTVTNMEKLCHRIMEQTVVSDVSEIIKDELSTMNLSCIERIYGDHGLEAIAELRRNPLVAAPVIVSRLKQKLEECIALGL